MMRSDGELVELGSGLYDLIDIVPKKTYHLNEFFFSNKDENEKKSDGQKTRAIF